MRNAELARELGNSVCAIEKRLGKLRLRRFQKWTPEREQFLRAHYRRLSARELAAECGMPPDYIRSKITELGLR